MVAYDAQARLYSVGTECDPLRHPGPGLGLPHRPRAPDRRRPRPASGRDLRLHPLRAQDLHQGLCHRRARAASAGLRLRRRHPRRHPRRRQRQADPGLPAGRGDRALPGQAARLHHRAHARRPRPAAPPGPPDPQARLRHLAQRARRRRRHRHRRPRVRRQGPGDRRGRGDDPLLPLAQRPPRGDRRHRHAPCPPHLRHPRSDAGAGIAEPADDGDARHRRPHPVGPPRRRRGQGHGRRQGRGRRAAACP